MQLEVPLETVYHTIALGARLGKETLLNPAPAGADLDIARLRTLGFFVPNETELALLTGLPVDGRAEIERAAQSLIAQGIRTVVVTMGSRGALLVTAAGSELISPVPVTPVDTTGAGDAFIGSFARFYVESRDLRVSLARAARYAAHSITGRGTQKSYATLAEFERFEAGL
jgi:ribokinase